MRKLDRTAVCAVGGCLLWFLLLTSFPEIAAAADAPVSAEAQAAYKAHLAKATKLVEQEKVEEAVAEVKAARALNPKGYEAPATLALILQAAGKPQEAAVAIAEALKLAPAEARPRVEAIAKMIGPEAAPQPAATATPAAEKQPTTALTGAARRKYDTLLVIVGEADQAKSAGERKKLLEEFLTKSAEFVGDFPDNFPVWVLRAGAAIELEQEKAASVAGSELLRLGAENMDDPKIRQLLAKLDRKGWLKTQAQVAEMNANAEKRAAEMKAQAERRLAEEKVVEERKLAAQKVEEERQRVAERAAADAKWKTMLEKGWKNSLGMRFVPVPNTEVLFCTWETRVQDYYISYKGKNIEEVKEFPRFPGRWGNGRQAKPDIPFMPGPAYPVVNINNLEAMAFCEWLTKKEQGEGHLFDQHYRLPTETEWKAALGMDSSSAYLWGNEFPPRNRIGNLPSMEIDIELEALGGPKPIDGYRDGYAGTAPVGSYPANRFGLFDMIGNIAEMCLARGKSCTVMGGGYWQPHPKAFTFTGDYQDVDFGGIGDVGFRLVLVRNR